VPPRKDHNQGRSSSLSCGRSTLILIFPRQITGTYQEDGPNSTRSLSQALYLGGGRSGKTWHLPEGQSRMGGPTSMSSVFAADAAEQLYRDSCDRAASVADPSSATYGKTLTEYPE
jgi:hypothetical protein